MFSQSPDKGMDPHTDDGRGHRSAAVSVRRVRSMCCSVGIRAAIDARIDRADADVADLRPWWESRSNDSGA
jgi:hypothetical protein